MTAVKCSSAAGKQALEWFKVKNNTAETLSSFNNEKVTVNISSGRASDWPLIRYLVLVDIMSLATSA